MNHKLFGIPLACLLLVGVTGCNNNDNAAQYQKDNNNFQRVGFYSNEDGGFMNNHRGAANGWNNGAQIERGGDDGLYHRNSDYNYHGHANSPEWMTQRPYYENYNGELANDISVQVRRVKDVKDVRTIVGKDTVLIGVQLDDTQHRDQAVHNIKEKVIPHLDGRECRVITSPEGFIKIEKIDNRLREGTDLDQVNEELEQLFSTLKEPFSNNKQEIAN